MSTPDHEPELLDDDLSAAIETLYAVFADYRWDDSEPCSLFDLPPEIEPIGIDLPLRDIPASVVEEMEFYEACVTEDVKHFLPRVLEVISREPSRFQGPCHKGLFNIELSSALQRWPTRERDALEKWAKAWLGALFPRVEDPEDLVVAVVWMGLNIEAVAEILSHHGTLLSMSLLERMWLWRNDKYWVPAGGTPDDVAQRFGVLCNWLRCNINAAPWEPFDEMPPDQQARVDRLLRAGRVIEAIVLTRQKVGCSFEHAKDMVDWRSHKI